MYGSTTKGDVVKRSDCILVYGSTIKGDVVKRSDCIPCCPCIDCCYMEAILEVQVPDVSVCICDTTSRAGGAASGLR